MATILHHFDLAKEAAPLEGFERQGSVRMTIFINKHSDDLEIKFEDSPGVEGYQMIRIHLDELEPLFPSILRHLANKIG